MRIYYHYTRFPNICQGVIENLFSGRGGQRSVFSPLPLSLFLFSLSLYLSLYLYLYLYLALHFDRVAVTSALHPCYNVTEGVFFLSPLFLSLYLSLYLGNVFGTVWIPSGNNVTGMMCKHVIRSFLHFYAMTKNRGCSPTTYTQ